jgi:peptide/nickel transport system permease protein
MASTDILREESFVTTEAAYRRPGPALRLLTFMRRKPLGAIGLAYIVIVGLMVIAAPLVTSRGPFEIDPTARLVSPNGDFWFGTDNLGRDLYSRVMYGGRTSLIVATSAVLLSTIVGTLLGMIAGFAGKRADAIISTANDGLMAIPYLLLAMTLVAVQPIRIGSPIIQSQFNVIIAITVSMLPAVLRVVRSVTLGIRSTPYVEAAVGLGASFPRLLFRHVLPNAFPAVIVYAVTIFSFSILAEAALSFLGLGIPPPYPSWGSDLGAARTFATLAPWAPVFPGLAIALWVFAVNMFGDAVRDVIDPRLRGSR